MPLAPLPITPLGDSALRIDCGPVSDPATAGRVAWVVRQLAGDSFDGVRDIVPAWTSVAVHYDAESLLSRWRGESPSEVVRRWAEERLASNEPAARDDPGREVVIPVVYGGEWGPDLEFVAARSGLACDEVVARHMAGTYRVRAVGFTPGFAYLEGLPPELATPRRESPRTRVAAGSVGIGGGQAGIYPLESPGGWNLLGRTPEVMFDVTRDPAPRLAVGDRVRFVAVTDAKWPAHQRATRVDPRCEGGAIARVTNGGLLTLVQDQGRWGRQHWGVSPGGAMGVIAARVANMLVGNPPESPLLECTLAGPRLDWLASVRVAVVGGEVEGVPMGRPFEVVAGESLDLSRLARGARCYLAVRGGLAAEEVLGGRGTHLQLGCGGQQGRPLAMGDLLLAGAEPEREPGPPSGHWFASGEWIVPSHPSGGLRVVRGPQWEWFSQEMRERLLSEIYRVSARSDRMGLRLEGVPLARCRPDELPSEPVVTGAIQVPHDGKPIVLGADRQTIGGYPVVACVASVDWDRLAQLRPGDEVRFVEISQGEAERLLAVRQLGLARLAEGLRRS